MVLWLLFEAIILGIFVFLGDKYSRMIVPAAFILSVNASVLIPIFYFSVVFINPTIEIGSIYEILYKFPHIYYLIIFSINLILGGCCFIASHWLLKTKINPPIKHCSIFSSFFIIFSLIVICWWNDIRKIIAIPYLTTSFMGILLLALLLFLFYIYTKLISKNNNENSKVNVLNDKSQIIQKLSKRELDVIRTVLMGKNTWKEISDKLNISVNTVKFHLKKIYKITKASSISDLLSFFKGIDIDT